MISLNDVLLAMSNIPVDDPIAEIWGRGLQGGDKIVEYTGSLPITINANGDVLIDYRIYGTDGGVGEPTESGEPAGYKLPMTVGDGNTEQSVPIYIGENQLDSVAGVADYVDKASGKIVRMIGEYTFTGEETFYTYGLGFYTAKRFSDSDNTSNKITIRFSHFTARNNCALGNMTSVTFGDNCGCFRIEEGNVMLRSTSNFTTVKECNAYFKAQYDNGTPVKMWYILATPTEEDPPVPLPEIPTIKGETVIDYDGDPKPSQMYVKYKDKG